MENVIVVGANGRSAREIIGRVAGQHDVRLTLFARRPVRLSDVAAHDATLIGGDARDQAVLRTALAGRDIVIVALGGPDLDVTTGNVVRAAETSGTRRIITINAGGIYDELPEPFDSWDFERAGHTRPTNLEAARFVEQSTLEYTILRPVWLTNTNVTEVELTRKDEVYKGTETSRSSLGAFVATVVADPDSYVGENLGIAPPNTEGDMPAAYR